MYFRIVLWALCCALASTSLVAANEPLDYCKRDCEIVVDSCNDECQANFQGAMLNRQMSMPSNPSISGYFRGMQKDVQSLSNHSVCKNKCSARREQCEFKCEATYSQK